VLTWLGRFLVLAALALIGLGGYLALFADRPDPTFAIDRPERVLEGVRVGAHTVEFGITNPARRPRRIVGLREG
jgi:hypothetical protein